MVEGVVLLGDVSSKETLSDRGVPGGHGEPKLLPCEEATLS